MFDQRAQKPKSLTTSRRGFLKLAAGSGAGLALAMHLPSAMASSQSASSLNSEGEFQPNAFVKIDPDNKVYVVIKHLEMGQGSFTGLATLVAEELNADWSQIVSESAPADTARYKNLHWGAQGTGGSSGMANSFQQMRVAGATAKAMLIAAAAQQWQVPAKQLDVSKGVISHKASGRTATFGELADAAAHQPVPAPESLTLKQPEDFQLIGKVVSRKDVGKANGTAIFTQDIKLDGMLTAVVAHSPRFGAKLKSFDANQAKQVKGVVDVVSIPNGVAVLAKDFWSAKKGRDQLQVQWDESAAMTKSSKELMDEYKVLSKKSGAVARNQGDLPAAFEQAETVIEAGFEFPYLAHAAMEPMNCVALVNDNGCEIWSGCQSQTQDQFSIAQALGIQPTSVRINTLFAGGSFGRRANSHSDYVLEAVNIAKAKPGIPVKMVWTREDDMRAGYYRPMTYHRIRAGVDKQGQLTAWDQTIVSQSIATGTGFEAFAVKDGVDSLSVEGAADMPYSIPNVNVDLHSPKGHVPVLWWRAVGNTHTAFAKEVMIDRMAKAAGKDPVAFRLELLKNSPRDVRVLKLAAEKAGWGRSMPKNHALGVAVHDSFRSFVAQVVEVSLQPNDSFKVEKVWCAVDCGIAVNPDVVEAQMQGGIGFGLSPTLMSTMEIENGKVVQSNFHDYQVLRMNQMPEVEVHIVPSAEAPTGVGEPGTPPIAPAVANALYALTGKEFDKLPLSLTS